MAEKVMLVLVDEGMSREDSHEILRNCSMEAIESNQNLFDICRNNEEIINKIDSEMLKEIFKPENHLGFSGVIVDRTIEMARLYLD